MIYLLDISIITIISCVELSGFVALGGGVGDWVIKKEEKISLLSSVKFRGFGERISGDHQRCHHVNANHQHTPYP
jgi:hypothetical protein